MQTFVLHDLIIAEEICCCMWHKRCKYVDEWQSTFMNNYLFIAARYIQIDVQFAIVAIRMCKPVVKQWPIPPTVIKLVARPWYTV